MDDANKSINNLNIIAFKSLTSPASVKKEMPLTEASIATVAATRKQVQDIIQKKSKKRLIIVGPCSIHDPKSALEYAQKLKGLAKEVSDTFVVLMRTYFEKPRTIVGWKGLINDPTLDNSFDINRGLKLARELLLKITESGLGVATESLEPISPQYIAELISWTAIGARTTESQTHREMASGLSAPVGFKNNTDGNIAVAVNAIKSALMPHHFLGIDETGKTSIVSTKGNPHAHIILRGGKSAPNYDKKSIASVVESLQKNAISSGIIIDCSHDNSKKNYKNQPKVFLDCIEQIRQGNNDIVGLMLESHLNEGNQPHSPSLKYGVSITDGCIDFDTTKELLLKAREILKKK